MDKDDILDFKTIFWKDGKYIDNRGLTREELEKILKEVEENHSFIQENTQLIKHSNSLFGKVKRILGSKKILSSGEVKKRAEELERAIQREKDFTTTEYSYEQRIMMLKYDYPGPEKISIFRHIGPHGDYSQDLFEITLKPFDYILNPAARLLHLDRRHRISEEEYMEIKNDLEGKKSFFEELKVKESVNVEKSVEELDKKKERSNVIEVDSSHPNIRRKR